MDWLWLFAPSFSVLVLVAGVLGLGAWVAARFAARSALEEIEGAAGADATAEALVRGRLVVEGKGAASTVAWSGAARCAASAERAGARRLWLRRGAFVAGARAEGLWIDTGSGRVRLEGPVALAMGSRVDLYAREVTLLDGDEVVAVATRHREPGSADDESVGYREAAGTPVLSAAVGASIRMASVRAPKLSGMWRLLASHRAMWAAYAVAGAFGIYLLQAYPEARARQRCEINGECGVRLVPPHQWWEHGPLRAIADSDEVCRAVLICTASGPPAVASTVWVHGVLNPPPSPSPEGCHSPCALLGACSAREGRCQAASRADCSLTEACVLWGLCSPDEGRCRALRDEDCAESRACRMLGHCRAIDGACQSAEQVGMAPATAEGCDAELCRQDGRCARIDGSCQATAAICASWDGCLFDGRCAVIEGACRLTAGACANTLPCRKLGSCAPSPLWEGCGVGDDANCMQSEVCAVHGWCSALPHGYLPSSVPNPTSRWFCFAKRGTPPR